MKRTGKTRTGRSSLYSVRQLAGCFTGNCRRIHDAGLFILPALEKPARVMREPVTVQTHQVPFQDPIESGPDRESAPDILEPRGQDPATIPRVRNCAWNADVQRSSNWTTLTSTDGSQERSRRTLVPRSRSSNVSADAGRERGMGDVRVIDRHIAGSAQIPAGEVGQCR